MWRIIKYVVNTKCIKHVVKYIVIIYEIIYYI